MNLQEYFPIATEYGYNMDSASLFLNRYTVIHTDQGPWKRDDRYLYYIYCVMLIHAGLSMKLKILD